MATVNFDFQSSGGKEIGKQFAAIAQRIDQSEGSLAKLAKTLNVSEQELADLAKELGVNGAGIQKLSKYLAESTAAGQKSEQQFAAISKVVGNLNPGSFEKLQKAVASSIVDTSKAVAKADDLADSYEKAAKSAGKAAKASGGITSTAFSKEASADRRNTSEIARLDRSAADNRAKADRGSQESIAQADRVSAEKQTAVRVEADKQIATIQANSAKDVAQFVTAQDAIQREKDRLLQSEIAAAEQKTDQAIAQLNASTAKEIAADQRAFDRVEKADDRALQERVKLIDADTSKEVARIQSDSNLINQDRERASRERIAAEDNATKVVVDAFRVTTEATAAQLIQQGKNESAERISAGKNTSKEIIAALEADSAKETALEKQRIASASRERIATEDNATKVVIDAFRVSTETTTAKLIQQGKNESAERIAAGQNASKEVIAALEADVARETALEKQRIAAASNERIATDTNANRLVVEAFKADSQRTTAQIVQNSRNLSQEKIAADREANRSVIAELDRASRERTESFKASINAETTRYVADQKIESAERQKELDRQQRIAEENRKARERAAARQQSEQEKAESNRRKAQSAAADASTIVGVSPQQAQRMADELGLNADQLQKGLPALQALYREGTATGESLRLVKAKFDLTSQQLATLIPAIKGVVSAQQQAAKDAKDEADRNALKDSQEKAALDFAQSLGVSRDKALEFAQRLGLTGDQMKSATKAITKLAKEGNLTGSTLSDVAEQYKLNATQAKSLGTAVGKRVQAEQTAAQDLLAQSKQAGLAARADAADQKRLLALDQFAATLGISKEAALELVQRFALTDVQMKGAAKKIEDLALAGELTAANLELVGKQYRVGSVAVTALTDAIRQRVADEKDQSDAENRQSAEAALAKAAIGLGIATGKTTDEAIALANELELTAAQTKAAPAAFSRLTKAGITGTQAIADLSRELGLTESQSGALVQALGAEVDRLKRQANADKSDEANAALKVASVELAQSLGVTADQLIAFANGAGLGAKELKTAITKIGSFAKSADQSDQALKTLSEGLGLNEEAARKLYRRILSQADAAKRQADQSKQDDAAQSLKDAQEKAALEFAQAIGKPRDQALQLARDLGLTGDQMKSATKAIAKLAQSGNLTGSTLADVAEQYKLNVTQAKTLGNIIGQRATAEQKAAQSALEQANQQKLAQRADAVEQKRLLALDQFAATLGLSKDAALELAQRFGLTDTQMKGAGSKIESLAKAGQLTESELALVQQQFKIGRSATQALTQAIAARVATEKDQSSKKARDAADAALAKASIGLGVAIGKTTADTIALAKSLGLTADQAKVVPTAFNRLTKAGITGRQAIDDLARDAGLTADQSIALTAALKAEVDRVKAKADQDKTTEATKALRVASVELSQKLGVTADQVFAFAQQSGLGAAELKTAVSKIGAFVKGTDQSEQALKSLAQGLGLNEAAAQKLYRRLLAEANAKTAASDQETEAAKQAELAKRANAEDQKRIAALSKFSESLGLTPTATRELVDRFALTGDQMKGVGTAFNRLAKAGKLTEDELAIVQQTYRVGDQAFAALSTAVRDRVATEKAAAAQQAANNAEEARQVAIKKALKAQYKSQQTELAAAQKADQSRALASVEVGRSLEVSGETIARFAQITNLSGAQLKTAVNGISKSINAGTLDQDLAALSKGLNVSRSALQFLAKRVQSQADQVAQQREADGQAALAANADKADRERTAALSQFARVLGLTVDQARELVDRFALTGTQMKGAGKALGQLAKAGQLTESELELVRQQFGLGRSTTAAMATAIEARVASEQAAAQATAKEAAETARRVAIQKELKTRYKQQQSALEKAEKADQSRALAAIEVSRTLGTSTEQLDRFTKSTQISGEGLRSAVRSIGKSVDAGTLDQDLAGLSKGLKLSESAVRFLAGRLQKQADQVAAERAAQRETDGQAALAAAADEADRKRVAVLSQFAQTMGISIDAARDLIQRFGLTGEQMKGASAAIDKLAKAGQLTSDEIALVQQRFRLSGVAINAMVSAIDQRVQGEQQAAAAAKAVTEAENQRTARQKALSAEYKKQQAAAEKARQADASLSLAAVELSNSLGTSSDRLIRFAQSTDLNAKGLKAAVTKISQSVAGGTLDRDLSGLAKGLQISESAVRFLAKRIQTKADEVAAQRAGNAEAEGQAKLSAAAEKAEQARTAALGKFADTLGLSVPAARALVDRFALTDTQMLKATAEIDRLGKQGKLTADRLEATRQSYRLSQVATDALAGAIENRIAQEKAQKNRGQLTDIGAKQQAAYAAALEQSRLKEQQRAAESAKQAAALGLSAESTDRFAKAADLNAQQLRAAVSTIQGMVKAGTATDAALTQLAPGLGLTTSAAKFLAKRLQSQADAAAAALKASQDKKAADRQATAAAKEQAKQARQLTAIGEKQQSQYAAAQSALSAELDKQRVAAIGFSKAIGTTSERGLRFAQAIRLTSAQMTAIGPQLQKLLDAGDLDGALSLLTNTYKLSERSARALIGKVEQRIQAEQQATDATKQQAAAESAAAAELKRRQQLADQEAAETKKRIAALQGFADAVGQTPDQALVLANILKLSSDQMRALPSAISKLVESGNDTDAALKRLGDTYGLQDRQLQKLTATIRTRAEQQGQARLAAGADSADQQRTAAMPGFAAATGLTEAAARELVTRFNLTGAQMQLVSGEMARLAQQGKLTDQAITLLGQKAQLGAAAQLELAAAVQQQADSAKAGKEQDALRKASLQLAQSLGKTGDETLALVSTLGLTAEQVRVLGLKLSNLARQGDVSELALQQLGTATQAPIAAITQLATAIRANVVTQQQAARQTGLIQETQKLSRALGLNADQALRFAQRLELTSQAIAQVDGLKKLYAQGPVSAAALEQFRQSTGLAAAEFNRLAAAVRSRVALEQQAAADKQADKDSTRAGRSAAAEGRAASSIAASLDIDLSGVQRLQEEVGKSAVELQKAIAVLNKLEGSATTADQKIDLLGQSFGLSEQQARQLVTAFDQCKASAKELGQNVASAAQDLGLSYGAALKLQQGLGMTSQQFEQAAQRASLLRQTGASTAEAFDALNKEFGITREQFDQLDRAALGSQQAMQGLATAAGAMSAALIGGFKQAIGVFAEYQGEIQKAGALAGSFNTEKGRQQFGELNAEVQKLGITTQFTSKEIAETSTELIRSGFSADQAKEAIGGIVTGAIASGDSMQQLAEVTGAALNTFGLIPAASGYVNDLVVATANASPAGVEDIGEALKYVGASAANAGQPIDEVMKAFARLAAAGIKGSTAGTGMAEAYRRLSLASAGSVTQFGNLVRGNKRAVEAFKALQLNIRKADGDLKPFSAILDQVRKSTQGFAKEDQAVLMNALFGVEGGRAVQAQLGLTEQKLQEIDQSFAETSGSSKRAADQMSQGISGALVSASSTIEALSLTIGQALSPSIEYLVRLFTGFLNTVILTFKAIPAPIQGAIGAVAGLVTVITTAVAAAAAFRAAATALGIAQGIAAAKTIALNAALALQSGNLVNVAKSLLGFSTATAASGAGATGLVGTLKGLGGTLAGVPAAMGAAGVSAKALAAGLGTIALQAAALFAAFELAKGIYEFIQAGIGATGVAKEMGDAFDALPAKFKEIEASNPFRKMTTDQDQAIQSVIQVQKKYEDFGAGLNSFASNISSQGIFKGLNQSFVELRAAMTGNIETLSKYGEAQRVVTYAQIEAQQVAIKLAAQEGNIQATFDEGQKSLVEYRKALAAAGNNTNAESVQKANAAAEESIAKLSAQIEALRKAGPDGAIALKPLEAILKSLQNRAPNIRPKVEVDPEQAKAEADKASQAVKDKIEQEQFTVKGKVELEYDNEKAARKLAFDQSAAREKLAFDQKADQEKAAFERQLNAEKAAVESRLNAEKAAFDAKQQSAKNAFESQLEQRKNQYETASQGRKDAFERSQESKKLAFESQVEERKRTFTAQQQAAEQSFTSQQESRARAFEASQQAAKKNFESQLAAIDASKKSQFDAQRAGVERQLQLEFAGSEEEKARLQEQFAKEDAQAARRQQLMAAIVAQEQLWEEQKRQSEIAFEEQQRVAKVAFDEQQRTLEQAFKAEQQTQTLEFEQQIATEKRTLETELQQAKSLFEAAEQEKKRQFELTIQQQKQEFERAQESAKALFEQQLNAKKQELEDQLNAKKLKFEQEQQRAKLNFEQQQQQKQLNFENAERARDLDHKKKMFALEKQFKDQERNLDKKAADQRAQQLKDLQNAPPPKPAEPPKPAPKPATPPKPKPRAKGGPVKRQDLYLVGEKGPELFTPSQNGFIVPNGPTRQLMGFAGGGAVRAGETIVVGEQGAEAFVPANAQGLKVTFDTTALDQSIRNGVAALDATLKQRMGGGQAIAPAPDAVQLSDKSLMQLKGLRASADSQIQAARADAWQQAARLEQQGKKDEARKLRAETEVKLAAKQKLFDEQLAQQFGAQANQPQSPAQSQPQPANAQLSQAETALKNFESSMGLFMQEAYRQADQLRWSGRGAEADQLIAKVSQDIQAQQTKLMQEVDNAKATAQQPAPETAKPTEEAGIKTIATNVATITEILKAASGGTGSKPPARRMGGPVESGTTYQVGEAGPELFVPGENGRILSNAQSVQVAERAMSAGQMATIARPADRPLPTPTKASGPGIGDVIRAIGGVHTRLAQLGGHTFNFMSDQSPQEDVYTTLRALRRAMA